MQRLVGDIMKNLIFLGIALGIVTPVTQAESMAVHANRFIQLNEAQMNTITAGGLGMATTVIAFGNSAATVASTTSTTTGSGIEMATGHGKAQVCCASGNNASVVIDVYPTTPVIIGKNIIIDQTVPGTSTVTGTVSVITARPSLMNLFP